MRPISIIVPQFIPPANLFYLHTHDITINIPLTHTHTQTGYVIKVFRGAVWRVRCERRRGISERSWRLKAVADQLIPPAASDGLRPLQACLYPHRSPSFRFHSSEAGKVKLRQPSGINQPKLTPSDENICVKVMI